MDLGIGIPNAVPGTTGRQLTEFARRADARGFSSLGTIDRLVYQNYEPLTALSAAAAVTERVGLLTSVLLGPLRPNAIELAKQALSVNALSGGRLTLGIGLGAREDDYEASGIEMRGRGARLDSMLDEIAGVWEREDIGPSIAGPPRILLGGHVPASFRRAAEHGAGWIAGGVPPEQFEEMAGAARDAWSAAGREDEPHIAGLAYFSLGPDGAAAASSYLTDYYGWLGEYAEQIAAGAAVSADAVGQYLAAYEEAGCDELVMFPCSSDPGQADLLADAAEL